MSDGISYQNKDILFKYLSDFYKDATLEVFGFGNFPRIKQLLPNEFPEVTADEKRSDTVFQLEDDSILMLEYESNNNYIENHLKYIRYAHRISQRYFQEEKVIKNIRIVVVYTSDVTTTKNELELGSLQINTKPVLLYQFNKVESSKLEGSFICGLLEQKLCGKYRLSIRNLLTKRKYLYNVLIKYSLMRGQFV